jgi:hypothetical protein
MATLCSRGRVLREQQRDDHSTSSGARTRNIPAGLTITDSPDSSCFFACRRGYSRRRFDLLVATLSPCIRPSQRNRYLPGKAICGSSTTHGALPRGPAAGRSFSRDSTSSSEASNIHAQRARGRSVGKSRFDIDSLHGGPNSCFMQAAMALHGTARHGLHAC